MDAAAYCEERIARCGAPLGLALGFAPAARRPGLVAVHALEAELREVAETSSDPNVGRARTAWWASELASASDGCPTHPVTMALTTSVPGDALAAVDLAAALEAVAAMAQWQGGERPVAPYVRALGAVSGTLGALAGGWRGPPEFAVALAGARLRLELAPDHERATARAAARAACDAVPAPARAALVDQLILAELALAGSFRDRAQPWRTLAKLGAPWIAWRTALRARRRVRSEE